jgi:hypothetical protein
VLTGGFGCCLVSELARGRDTWAVPAPALQFFDLRTELFSAPLLRLALVRFAHTGTLSRERGDLLPQ